MRKIILCCLVSFFIVLSLFPQTEDDVVGQRTIEILKSLEYFDGNSSFNVTYLDDYLHPDFEGNSLQIGLPLGTKKLLKEPGVYIIESFDEVRIAGIQKYIENSKNSNKIVCYLVTLEYTVIAEKKFRPNEDRDLKVLYKPVKKNQYVIMVLDTNDSKWKYYESMPDTMYYYTKDFLYKNFQILEQQYSITNILKTIKLLQK